MEMAPHCSQKLHIVRWPFRPAAHATRSLGIWEQLVLEAVRLQVKTMESRIGGIVVSKSNRRG
jgi:hypothetical protein